MEELVTPKRPSGDTYVAAHGKPVRVLVTDADGFIGSVLTLSLLRKSNRPWDRFVDEACGRRFLIIRPKR
jgi:hypothetical protein